MPKSLAEIEKQFKDWLDFKEWSPNTLTIVFEEAEHGVIARIPYKELEGLFNSLIVAERQKLLADLNLYTAKHDQEWVERTRDWLASLEGKDANSLH